MLCGIQPIYVLLTCLVTTGGPVLFLDATVLSVHLKVGN